MRPETTERADSAEIEATSLATDAGNDWEFALDQRLDSLHRWQLIAFLLLILGIVAGFLLTLAWGSVNIPLDQTVRILIGKEPSSPAWETIVLRLRLPRAIAAIVAGAGLGVSGLQMQTLFRNALADPYILGISSGATLGVGLVVLSAGPTSVGLVLGSGNWRSASVVVAAALGAGVVMVLMLLIASRIRNSVILLVVGVMVGSFVSAFVSLMIFFSTPESIRSFATWGFGSFQAVQENQIPMMVSIVFVGVGIALVSTKQLNALLLGEAHAQSLGVSIRRARLIVMISASIIAGTITAFCGPIAFLGIAVPHLARGLFRTANHRVLMPAVILLGALSALICGIFAELPGHDTILPLNAATALLGAPIVLWVLLKLGRTSSEFAV